MGQEFVEVLFDDFSENDEKKFKKDTVSWLANLIKSEKFLKPVRAKNALKSWPAFLKDKWCKSLSVKNVPVVLLEGKLRDLNPSTSHDSLLAKDLLESNVSQATITVFSVLNERSKPKRYEYVNDYHKALNTILKNRMKVTIIDSYLLETTAAIIQCISKPKITDKQLGQLCQKRIEQVKLLLMSFFSQENMIEGLRRIELVSMMIDHKKWSQKRKDAIEKNPESRDWFEDENRKKEASEKVADYILTKLSKEIPGLQKRTIEIRDLRTAIEEKDIKKPHDRMIIVDQNPEWCATAGFALDVYQNDTLSPQGFFVKFLNVDAFELRDFSSFVADKRY